MNLHGVPTDPSVRFLRQFAAGSVAFLGLAGTAFWFRGRPVAAVVAWALGAAIGLAGLVLPRCLRWVYVAIALAVLPVGLVVSTTVLLAAFLLVVTPIALIMRLLGRDALTRRFDPSAPTYWRPHPPSATNRYFRQF